MCRAGGRRCSGGNHSSKAAQNHRQRVCRARQALRTAKESGEPSAIETAQARLAQLTSQTVQEKPVTDNNSAGQRGDVTPATDDKPKKRKSPKTPKALPDTMPHAQWQRAHRKAERELQSRDWETHQAAAQRLEALDTMWRTRRVIKENGEPTVKVPYGPLSPSLASPSPRHDEPNEVSPVQQRDMPGPRSVQGTDEEPGRAGGIRTNAGGTSVQVDGRGNVVATGDLHITRVAQHDSAGPPLGVPHGERPPPSGTVHVHDDAHGNRTFTIKGSGLTVAGRQHITDENSGDTAVQHGDVTNPSAAEPKQGNDSTGHNGHQSGFGITNVAYGNVGVQAGIVNGGVYVNRKRVDRPTQGAGTTLSPDEAQRIREDAHRAAANARQQAARMREQARRAQESHGQDGDVTVTRSTFRTSSGGTVTNIVHGKNTGTQAGDINGPLHFGPGGFTIGTEDR